MTTLTMRQTVSGRLERFDARRAQAKRQARFGWLIAPATLVIGWVVLIIGIITIPLPGQGWLTTFLGVGILSLEAVWARNLLTWGVRVYDDFFAWYRRQPRALRWSLIAVLLVAVWITFMALAWAGWALGGLNVLTPVFHGWLGWDRP